MKRAERLEKAGEEGKAFWTEDGDGHGDKGQSNGLSKGKQSLRGLILLLENSFLINPKRSYRTDCPL